MKFLLLFYNARAIYWACAGKNIYSVYRAWLCTPYIRLTHFLNGEPKTLPSNKACISAKTHIGSFLAAEMAHLADIRAPKDAKHVDS